MRIWSLHPKYLDSKGLVALWRETLLARHVLQGKTVGYRNHPQLIRFRSRENPVQLIDQYLSVVYDVACAKGYSFDKTKFDRNFPVSQLTVTEAQIEFEKNHLLEKLKLRDNIKYVELLQLKKIEPHPIFRIIKGEIEDWEKVKQ